MFSKNRFRTVLAAGLLAAAGCASAPKTPPTPVLDVSTTRSVTGGQIAGFVDADTSVRIWRSIPFAAPPVGDLRWRAPRPVNDWDGVRAAVDHAPWCPQVRSALDDGSSADSVPIGAVMGQEDCLYLNVYAPEGSDDAGLPVMMWIHGGSNTWGRAEQYDPTALVAKENVVVVVVQYRLGPLGWFAHPELRRTAETELDRSANFGNLDHIAALNWIGANIQTFGGNPENITIFGESAGGHDVVALLASPKAAGLFHKAIIQSGSFRSMPLDEAEQTDPLSATAIAAKLLGGSAQSDAATALRAVPVSDIFAAYESEDGESDLNLPRIIQDGIVLPSTPMRDAFQSTATFNAVPIITGSNKDETKLWNIMDERLVKWRFGIIPVARDPEFYDTVSEYPSRMWRATAVDGPAADMASGGHRDVWTYRFDWDEGRKYWGADFAQLFGAAHSLEIPFVMGQFRFLGDADKYIFTKQNAEERFHLSSVMMRHWANFARSGNPGGEWQRWSPDGDNIMLFDSISGGGVRMIADNETSERIVRDLQNDASVTESERCLVAFATRWWSEDPDTFLSPSCGPHLQDMQ